jgi:SAM-dependent methyltransferase
MQCHECPARAIAGLVKEAFRVLRPGGTIALTDNSVGISFVSLFLRVQVCKLVKKSTNITPFFILKFFAAKIQSTSGKLQQSAPYFNTSIITEGMTHTGR